MSKNQNERDWCSKNHRVLVNLFVIKSNHFDYFDAFKEEFNPVQIYESYYEVF
jgi:hypothetical protein